MRGEIETPEATNELQRKLTPANENPWYVLMTLYGEREGKRVDLELHEKNRRAWNAWASQSLSSEEKGEVVNSSRLTWGELEAWEKISDEITARYLAEYLRRNPNVDHPPELPDPRRLISCKEIEFSKQVQFSGMLFCGSADFGESIFCHGANYSGAMFLRDAYFYSVKFEGKAFFPSVSFSQWTEFGKAEFKKLAYFQSAKWSVDVDFREALFTGEANFEEASFRKSALFQSAKFFQNAQFSLTTFKGFVYFAGAVFGRLGGIPCLSNFSECHFSKPTSFRGAKFHDAFPNFSGTILHDKTRFTAKSVPADGGKRSVAVCTGRLLLRKTLKQHAKAAPSSATSSPNKASPKTSTSTSAGRCILPARSAPSGSGCPICCSDCSPNTAIPSCGPRCGCWASGPWALPPSGAISPAAACQRRMK
ncbi:hypothetical protein GKC28_08545 [Leisingera sp. ANG59]|nr:hypothetical protein [Leisingera sp. ANG59]